MNPGSFKENKIEEIRPKSQEVFTDDTCVIGPNDEIEILEAIPISCTVLIVAKPEIGIAGIAHLSLGLGADGVTEKINELKSKLSVFGLEFSSSHARLFNAGDVLTTEIHNALEDKSLLSEIIPAEFQGVRVDKKTGKVSFFSTFPN